LNQPVVLMNLLADMRPAGQYAMSELIAIGGIQPLLKTLLAEGLLHGGCMTVTGRTLAERLASVAPYPSGQRVIRPLSNPIKKDSHLVVLYGNRPGRLPVLATRACTSAALHGSFTAKRPRCARSWMVWSKGDVVVVLRRPRADRACAMLSPTSAINGRGLSRMWR
jgi:dihydroxy-acid dehydratase